MIFLLFKAHKHSALTVKELEKNGAFADKILTGQKSNDLNEITDA
jgi:hypothetical protein